MDIFTANSFANVFTEAHQNNNNHTFHIWFARACIRQALEKYERETIFGETEVADELEHLIQGIEAGLEFREYATGKKETAIINRRIGMLRKRIAEVLSPSHFISQVNRVTGEWRNA